MIQLIFNADDFGYSRGVNLGIIDAYQFGLVRHTTMMMNMPHVQHAMELAKQHPELDVGIHLVLTCGKPLIPTHTTIVNEQGEFFKQPKSLFERHMDWQEVEAEWRAQINRFFEFGLVPTHLDSHHHLHQHTGFLEVILKLAKEYHLPVRHFEGIDRTVAFSDVFRSDFYGDGVSEHTLQQIADAAQEGQTIEIMTHPAYLDQELLERSSYNLGRVKELQILMTWRPPDHVKVI